MSANKQSAFAQNRTQNSSQTFPTSENVTSGSLPVAIHIEEVNKLCKLQSVLFSIYNVPSINKCWNGKVCSNIEKSWFQKKNLFLFCWQEFFHDDGVKLHFRSFPKFSVFSSHYSLKCSHWNVKSKNRLLLQSPMNCSHRHDAMHSWMSIWNCIYLNLNANINGSNRVFRCTVLVGCQLYTGKSGEPSSHVSPEARKSKWKKRSAWLVWNTCKAHSTFSLPPHTCTAAIRQSLRKWFERKHSLSLQQIVCVRTCAKLSTTID